MELNVLSESLDGAMAEWLGSGPEITDALYAEAYRAVGRAQDRERQIELIALLGQALDKLTHLRFIGMTLKLMRGPARAAGLGELQAFLERGYAAFGAMRGGAGEFVSIVVARERAISRALLAGDDEALRRPPAAVVTPSHSNRGIAFSISDSGDGHCRGQKTNIAVNRCDPNALRKDLHTVKLSECRNSLPAQGIRIPLRPLPAPVGIAAQTFDLTKI